MPSSRERANAIRALAMDAVERAGCGHPGAPMGMADIAELLWRDWLRHNPADPEWLDRDRVVLSNGHASMLLYAALHLCGYNLGMDDLRAFRQLHSRTPGHPEYGMTPGVEATTGPLGQGFANAVGMALAEKLLAARFNRPGYTIINHRTWVFAGDGCLMEGISHEAASLAGTLSLGKLILIFDDNGISIDGAVRNWCTDDVAARFRAYGWQVIDAVDGHDREALDNAFTLAVAETGCPTLICAKTRIGFGSPHKQDKAAAHGAALGAAEVAASREALGWHHPPFEIPEAISAQWDCRTKGARLQDSWRQLWDRYGHAHPELHAELQRLLRRELPAQFDHVCRTLLDSWLTEGPAVATRQASKMCLDVLGPILPELIGGSADLSGSNCTRWANCTPISRDSFAGNYIHYGVREFAMTAIANGMTLHGGLRPYTGTFLVFLDYARGAVRLAALARIPQILVYTHDSIGVGEDGPTHQPIEQLASLRSTPGMSVWRPCDAVETLIAWRAAIRRTSGPSALVLSRQKLPAQERDPASIESIARGAYILVAERSALQLIFLATGSEVSLAVAVAAILAREGIGVRVLSMPCCDAFASQEASYRDHILPPDVRCRLAIETSQPDYWRRYVGLDGDVFGMDGFGASAPLDDLLAHHGFTVANLTARARALLRRFYPEDNR